MTKTGLGPQLLADLGQLLPVSWVSPALTGILQTFWHIRTAEVPLSCLSHCCASSWDVVWCMASTLCERSCRLLENFSICSMIPFKDLQRGGRGGPPLWTHLVSP